METQKTKRYVIVSARTAEELQHLVNQHLKRDYEQSGSGYFAKGMFHQPMVGIEGISCITKGSLRDDIDNLIEASQSANIFRPNNGEKGLDDESVVRRMRYSQHMKDKFINQIWFWLKDEIKGEED